ncbi:cytochrome P450 CYP4G25 [Danaus plexippus plexippus]|uniref:Cytochrome P450 CYP4G25 n=1 Tax=Danaus plexippus plexippus TaxID=278856 RepID=A0A212EQ78_DANPL|nr:cytochrome P450 CYP4G25 [Danaus plexippus plexippus]
MIIFLMVVFLFCMYWLFWMSNTRRIEKFTASLPMPPSLPVIGHAALFLGNTEKILKNLEDIASIALKNNGAVKLWLGPKLYIAIGNPEDAQLILENCLDKDVVYRFLRPWLGQGLFIAPLRLWKMHRKILLPVFHNKVIEEYIGVISKQADVLTERLEEQSGKETFDVLSYISACTLDIVFETSMGEKMDVQHWPDTPYLRARHTVMEILNKRLFKVWLQPDCLFKLTRYAKEQKKNIDLTHKFTDEVVQKRRLQFEAKEAIGINNTKDSAYSKVTIPSGVGAVVGAFAIHRSVDLWGSNANEFDPDRFLPERSKNRHPCSFIPFSHGSRNCIGRNFGMIIIKGIISNVIRSFRIQADEVGPLKIEMLLFPIRGHQIKITKRMN